MRTQRSLRPSKRWIGALLCMELACPLAAMPTSAYADTRQDDLVLGQTVEARNLSKAKGIDITAQYAYVVDAEGKVYFERNAYEKTQIASVTKVMTAIVALEQGNLDDVITVSEEAASIGESSAALAEGDELTLGDALKALLIPSGNDAAVAIAQYIGAQALADGTDFGTTEQPADDIEAFVALMNKKTRELGCVNTLYTNPHGLDYDEYEGCYSCAYDQGLICSAAMKMQTFRDIAATGSTDYIVVTNEGEEREVELEPTDTLFETFDYCIGIKTGNTESAGPCYAGAMNYEGYEVYAIILKADSEWDRFNDAQTIFEWIITHRVPYKKLTSTQTAEMTISGQTTSVPVLAEVAHSDWVDKTFAVTIAEPNTSLTIIDCLGNVSIRASYTTTSGDIHAGDVVGTAEFIQQNDVIATQDIIACEDCAAPNFLEAIGIAFDRFIRNLRGESTQAMTREVYTPTYVSETSTVG